VGLELKTGSRGVFKVRLDGEIVYDKTTTRRFPRAGEVAQLVEGRLGRPLHWRKN
jgi:predicted Rdx family selenoprotein